MLSNACGWQVNGGNGPRWPTLSRQTCLDTRFELDVDVDADSDTAPMTLVDGGMHGTLNPTYAGNLQEAAWPSLIDRPSHDYEAHYFDFLVEVPDAGEDTFLGYVSYQDIQLWIYSDRYELWDVSGTPTLLGTYYDTTKGRRNIGIRAGYDSGVWVDGTQIFNSGPALASKPVAGFGSQAMGGGEDYQPGLTLFENLTYTRSFNRTQFSPGEPTSNPGTLPPGMPRVTTTFFDAVVDVTSMEVRDTGVSAD